MDHEYFKELTSYLKKYPGNSDVLISIADSVKEYHKYILINIFNYYVSDERHRPFRAMKRYWDTLYFLDDYAIGKHTFNLDISMTNVASIQIDFSVRSENNPYQQLHPYVVLRTIGLSDQFEWRGERYYHTITGSFEDFEQKTTNFIDNFLKLLIENEKSILAGLNGLDNSEKTN